MKQYRKCLVRIGYYMLIISVPLLTPGFSLQAMENIRLNTQETYLVNQIIREQIGDDSYRYEYFPNRKEKFIFDFLYPKTDEKKLEERVTAEVFHIRDQVKYMASQLVDNLEASIRNTNLSRTDIVLLPTTFVNLDSLYQTSPLGRYLSEQLANELYALGMEVLEVRKTNQIMVEPGTGELGLSRQSTEISQAYKGNTILTGTYTITPFKVIVNARLVDSKSNEQKLRSIATGVFDRRNNLMVNYLLSKVNTIKTMRHRYTPQITPTKATEVTITELRP